MLVKEKMKINKYLIVVTNDDLLQMKVKNINFLFPVRDYSVGFLKTFSLQEIQVSNAYLYINRILDKESIFYLKKELSHLNKNIIGLCFTDLGILSLVKELGLSLQLIYMQYHNTTNALSINYYLEYVDSVLISTDITKAEILSILDKTKKSLVVPYFSLVDVMYSRRTLLTNYNQHFNSINRKEEILQEEISNQDFYALENQYGTVLYAKKYIDYREIQHENILFYFINPLGLKKEEVESILKGEKLKIEKDTGFLNKETYYLLKEEEDWKK